MSAFCFPVETFECFNDLHKEYRMPVNHKLTARKRQIITRILGDSAFSPESGIYQAVVKALLKMSENDIANLENVINLKRKEN